MKALRKQRLCSFLWGWGKWENRPCSIQKRPGISLPDRFFLFQGGNTCRPTLNSCQIHLARVVQHIPVTGGIAYAVPPVNPWLSSDRASGLRKRQKGQLASSPCQFMAFIGPRQRSGKKTKGTACAVPLSIYGFHRTAPAVWKKDKRDSLRCPSCLWGNHKI